MEESKTTQEVTNEEIENEKVTDEEVKIKEEQEKPEKKDNSGKIVKMVGIPALAIILGIILFFNGSFLGVILFFVGLFVIIVGIKQWLDECPQCGEWAGLQEIDRKLIGEKDTVINKQVKDKVYTGARRYGQPDHTIIRNEKVAATAYTYNVKKKCKCCGYITYVNKTETVEK